MIGKHKLAKVITKISREIIIDQNPIKHYPMRFGLDICVTEEGVMLRNELASLFLQDTEIANKWSDKSLLSKIDSIVRELGGSKKEDMYPDFPDLSSRLINELGQEFEEKEVITIVEGLTLKKPLTLGSVTFVPLEDRESLLKEPLNQVFFKDTLPHRDCIATAKYKVESQRAIELLRGDTEYCLNIIRFIATLVWYREPTRQINIAGEPRQTSEYSLVLEPNGQQLASTDTDFSVLPINLNDEILPYFDFNGLSQIAQLLSKANRNDLENALLTGIQWFGDATRELQPLAAFLKFYTPLDVILKSEVETARKYIPKRIVRLLDPWNTDKKKHLTLVAEVQDLIVERNSVFHSGFPRKRTPEYLRLAARYYSAGCLNQTRQRIQQDKLSSRQDLYNWLAQQAKRFKLQ